MSDVQRVEGLGEAEWRALLGRKISLRYRLHDDSDPFSEAIGVVMGVRPGEGGGSVTILNKRGEQIIIAIDDILAGKVFPS